MKIYTKLWLAALFLLGAFSIDLLGQAASANDDIFPPAPAAASAVSFDGRGFLIHGQRTFIASGGMEYARIPHALWRDRLLRLKRAGFNCVEIYTFWNIHEPRPNQFNFAGDADLDAFLKTAHALGLYAIVRVGPYYCAEWDSGGYPVWLRFVPNLRVREDNPAFLAAADRFWDHLMPIVAANQINHGGSVILVQLENEHPSGWGTEVSTSYFKHLQSKAIALGLEVPYFFSGLHHSGDPAGDTPWSSAGRTSPWFSTEFWSTWYDRYGATQSDTDTYDRRIWKVLAYGGNGLNFYMFHGGSNFGYTNSDEDTASYDYGAAIGQAGDLRPTYYRFKRAALFARSFEAILEDSDNASDAYKDAATDPSVRVTARKSPSGTLLFLDNPTGKAVKTQTKEADGTLFPSAGSVTLAPGQIAPIVHDFPLVPGVVLERATPLLGIQHDGSLTTIVTDGSLGDVAELRFRVSGPVVGSHGTLSGDHFTVQDTSEAHTTTESSFKVSGQTIRILTMSTDWSDHAWFVQNSVLVGPEYVGDATVENGKPTLTMESRTGEPGDAFLYGLGHPYKILQPCPPNYAVYASGPFPNAVYAPPLSAWQTLPGDLKTTLSYSDLAWKPSADPLPMGADGDTGAYAWYRTTASVPTAGTYMLRFSGGGDWASVFVDGEHIGSSEIRKGYALTLPAGPSRLTLLTAHYGRQKLFYYLGPIDTIDAKGLVGSAILDSGKEPSTAITQWRVKADADSDHAAPPSATDGPGWSDGTSGPDIFAGRHGFAWYVAALPAQAGPRHRLQFANVDDNATVYLNGTKVAAHNGWGKPFDVGLDAVWNPNGPNTLAVLVENTDSGGGINGAVGLQTINPGDVIPLTQWTMHGGIAPPGPAADWQPGMAASAGGAPAFYRAAFTTNPPAAVGPHPILRVTTAGLSRGFIWLNGHNLGRYPEKVAVNGLYLPEPWLNSVSNELVIFDEDGHTPSAVKVVVEDAASRFIVPMTESSGIIRR